MLAKGNAQTGLWSGVPFKCEGKLEGGNGAERRWSRAKNTQLNISFGMALVHCEERPEADAVFGAPVGTSMRCPSGPKKTTRFPRHQVLREANELQRLPENFSRRFQQPITELQANL